MTTTQKSSLRFEAPFIVGFILVFIGLVPAMPREALGAALVLFFLFGAYTEFHTLDREKSKKEKERRRSQRLFSETEFVVPVCVAITLIWTYLQMTTDGQTFTQRILGVVGCIIALGMLWFYLRKRFSNTLRVGLGLILGVCTFASLYQHSNSLAWAYDFQKGFNEMVEERQKELNDE